MDREASDGYRLAWDDDRILAAIRGASMEGLELAAEHLLQASSVLVPLEEGDLERSGEVSTDADDQAAAVSYDRPYAVRQHEELTWRHDAGRQAKYLEQPMTEERDTMLQLLAGPPRDLLGG
ncbi:hypothetical protein Ait01nite_030070 [Actinoplanes italicus]|uniref:HK97 gp10 family phage protein n=1 Tax=Actinoplanes italicus TaxID=113567 RepID=A0A2T0KIX5_9ACTN|nr:minor capsid protein [Actinoplanes italicus]PRX23464.1 hypothetical protein CLV67_103212 [Actinoplanes italicus]GIE29962.1 hypothetical protein Ait01nite_030070 [Actinoplanes italicus]